MSNLSIMSGRVAFETLRTLAEASISGSFAKVGTPLLNPARIIHVYNGTDADMIFSIDGVNNDFYVPSGGFILFDFTTNHPNNVQGFYLAEGTQFWVKEAAAVSTGAVWIAVVYGLSIGI